MYFIRLNISRTTVRVATAATRWRYAQAALTKSPRTDSRRQLITYIIYSNPNRLNARHCDARRDASAAAARASSAERWRSLMTGLTRLSSCQSRMRRRGAWITGSGGPVPCLERCRQCPPQAGPRSCPSLWPRRLSRWIERSAL